MEQKAVDVLIRAFAPLSDATLIIVGAGPLDGPLKKLAAELNANCLFLGERSDVEAILPALDVYALSSAWEGEPLSLLEAMACRLPVVSTDTPGSRDILDDGAAGLLVPIWPSGASLGTEGLPLPTAIVHSNGCPRTRYCSSANC